MFSKVDNYVVRFNAYGHILYAACIYVLPVHHAWLNHILTRRMRKNNINMYYEFYAYLEK